ncbi:MAG TPA: VCBS repeat-containing protein [Verrucomicrobiae bacterium]
MALFASELPPVAVPGSLPLAQSNRVYIAEIEHRGLTLTRIGFPAIAAAIKSADAPKLARFFAPSFRGETILPEQGAGPESDALKIHRVITANDAKQSPVAVDARGFADYLIGLRSRFAAETKVALALMSLSPAQREKLDGIWQGSLEFRLIGPRRAGGSAELVEKIEFEFGTVPDVDGIASEPGWVKSMRVVEAQEATATHELMAEVAKERGIDRSLFQDNWSMPPSRRAIVTGGVYLADIDNDGRQDILVTDMKGLFLFRGLEGGRFEDVTARAGLPTNLRGVMNAVFGDFDNDGLVDLILPGRVFRNAGQFQFEDITARVPFQFGNISGFTVGDYDKDGRLDLYVSRMNTAQIERAARNSWIDGPGGPGNQLWHNLGNWKFEDVSASANAAAGHRSVFTAAWLDANNDGWPDLYVINEFGGGILLVNRGNGTFKEQPLLDDAGDFGSMGMAVADFNNDGNIDIYTANMYSKAGRRIMENLPAGSYPPDVFAKMKRFVTGSELYRNLGALKFERVGKSMRVHAVGWAYGAAFLDLDNDGFLDLYGTAGFMSVNKEEPDG